MNQRSPQCPKYSKPTVYCITVKGTLNENWSDWFNKLQISFEHEINNTPTTVLTCRVRDQAELNGILNWLHNMNLKLIRVIEKE